jgi:hypothetical protein
LFFVGNFVCFSFCARMFWISGFLTAVWWGFFEGLEGCQVWEEQ